jgi:hypothetical protein
MTAVILRVVLSVALIVALASRADGQPPERGVQVPPGEMTPGQLQQLFDAMLVMQAQEALSLSEQQYAQFLTRLKVLQDTRRRNQVERVRLIGDLQRLTNPRSARAAATDGEIKERLTALHELESRAAAETRRAYNAIDDVLDIRQQARFRVFEDQIERRKLELIGRARQNNPNRQATPSRRVPPRRPPPR